MSARDALAVDTLIRFVTGDPLIQEQHARNAARLLVSHAHKTAPRALSPDELDRAWPEFLKRLEQPR